MSAYEGVRVGACGYVCVSECVCAYACVLACSLTLYVERRDMRGSAAHVTGGARVLALMLRRHSLDHQPAPIRLKHPGQRMGVVRRRGRRYGVGRGAEDGGRGGCYEGGGGGRGRWVGGCR
jgi:uncharacterized membrane protein YgcG